MLSIDYAKYMCRDIKNFYLGTPLDWYEYMKMPVSISPSMSSKNMIQEIRQKIGPIYLEIRREIYRLPQAGALANRQLKEQLVPAGYYEVPHTSGLWKHISYLIQFTLVVDDFGVKYIGKQHVNHLIKALTKEYEIPEDWIGGLYSSIELEWDSGKRTLDFSMPGYIIKVLQKYKNMTNRPSLNILHIQRPQRNMAQLPKIQWTLTIHPTQSKTKLHKYKASWVIFYTMHIPLIS